MTGGPSVVANLAWALGVNTEGTVKGLKQADRAVVKFGRRTQRETRMMNRAFVGVSNTLKTNFLPLLGLGGGLSLAAAVQGIRQVSDEMGRLADQADKVGVTVEALQELRSAAVDANISAQTLDMGIQRFSRRVAEAQAGTGELRDTLKQYNIALTEADGTQRSVEAILRDYADAVANAGTEQERLRLAFKGFDSEGAALVNILRGGAEGLDAYAARARELGHVIDEDLVRAAKEFDRALDSLALTIETKFKAGMLEVLRIVGLLTPATDQLDTKIQALEQTIAKLEEQAANPTWWQRILDIGGTGRETIIPGLVENAKRELEGLYKLREAMNAPQAEQTVGAAPGAAVPVATQKAIEAMQARRNQLERLTEAYKDSADAVQEANKQTAIENAYKAAGIEETSHLAGQVRWLTEEEIRLNQELEETQRNLEAIEAIGTSAFDSMADALSDAVIDMEFSMTSLRGTVLSVIRDIQKDLFKLGFINPLKNALFGTASATLGGGGGGGGIFGGILDNILVSDSGGIAGDLGPGYTGRAAGGPVMAGQSYLIGERRQPEIFTPNVPGTITPASDAAAKGAGVVVNMNIGLGVQEAAAVELANKMPEIQSMTTAAIMEAQARGGSIANRLAR